jgi:hypothetical protein
MSFDLYFVPARNDDDWDAVMDELEAAAESRRSFTPDDLAMWERIKSGVMPLAPGWEEATGEKFRELSSDSAGMQVSMSPGEVSLNVAYWHTGDDAKGIVSQLRRIAAVIEEATGLEAYDPQAGGPFIESDDAAAASTFDQSAAVLRTRLADREPSARKRRWPFKAR